VKASQPAFFGVVLGLALAGVACQGEIAAPPEVSPQPARPGETDPGTSGSGSSAGGLSSGKGSAGSVNAGKGSGGNGSGGNGSGGDAAPADVNRVAIHRLNNAEYDNTISDLLEIESSVGAAFIADEKLFGFDTIAAAFGMSDARFEEYFNAADTLAEQAFASDVARAKILICTPESDSDLACAEEILEAFALRAFRRPATQAELERLLELVSDATELGEDFSGAIKNAVKAMLSSAAFLYRIELDSDPGSDEPHPLTAYELGSRLSYLVWSTMPDEELFEVAASGELTSDEVLADQLERLLADGRSQRFIASFGGQWLGLRQLESHQVDANEYADWNESLQTAMVAEGIAYFTEFVEDDRDFSEFLRADVNFVNAELAELYGFSQPDGEALVRVEETSDERRGFLGLASFLTLTSFSKRTAPTLRGNWVLENLLCDPVPPPPAAVPELDSDDASGEASDNVRERLEAHRSNPSCAGCHDVLDPIGLGLEHFDAIGRYRRTYADGEAVDAAGTLPTGEEFDGLLELSDILANDERLTDCVVQKLMTYALSREIVASDASYRRQIEDGWAADGLGLASLLRRIVLHESFRFRRGEP
jgi:hypothetical protein